jgi:hypothetical protein
VSDMVEDEVKYKLCRYYMFFNTDSFKLILIYKNEITTIIIESGVYLHFNMTYI